MVAAFSRNPHVPRQGRESWGTASKEQMKQRGGYVSRSDRPGSFLITYIGESNSGGTRPKAPSDGQEIGGSLSGDYGASARPLMEISRR